MYSILMDTKTKSFYMDKGELKFYAYTEEENCKEIPAGTRLVSVDILDYQEFMTFLYNAGFVYGYLDGELIRIKKSDILYFKQNINEVVYAQYLLTKDSRYLQIIKKSNLCTLCNINNEKGVVLFPTVTTEDGSSAVLTYTDPSRIPVEMFSKYQGWKIVRMTFDAQCIVNGKFIAV